MTSAEIRQSFLDFFAERGHTIVPSSSLMPDSPGLLFTNAGMNQFVPIFLGERTPDVSGWAGARAAKDTRAADTQKCIRAGGKHNDLEDVGYDTYHHTLFEMLGNWSFGDYFKSESLTWGWELITQVWGIPPKRLFATVYSPEPGDPSEFDQDAYDIWKQLFEAEGLDPEVHIVNGNKKDNFWMMGDTGPCGPCSEIHFNLLEDDDEQAGRTLVNNDSPRCIEIWNHVFIQFNANADGTFSPLAAKHVDTGMGFERVAGIHATTNGFTDFSKDPSNYAADHFQPIFAKVAQLSGKTYTATVPTRREGLSEQEMTDVAFRVLADHARTIACAIADGILPGNDGRNYVIRRILRRGILYGKKLGLGTGFFEQLIPPVIETLGPVFPELVEREEIIRKVVRGEEESFGKTLDRGLIRFHGSMLQLINKKVKIPDEDDLGSLIDPSAPSRIKEFRELGYAVPGSIAFELYDTYGFPLDMTQLLATERGLTVDVTGFNQLMKKKRDADRAAHVSEVVVAATEGSETVEHSPTEFVGYDPEACVETNAQLLEVIATEKASFLVFDRTPFYAEMGGQVGDQGTVTLDGQDITITDTTKDKSGRYLHKVEQAGLEIAPGTDAVLKVALNRRRDIQRHHSATHLLHFALREVLGDHVRQAGSLNAPDRLRFDFSHFEQVSREQIGQIESIVNTRILENSPVEAYETEFDQKPEGTLAFFGEKYGRIVRVVDIGGFSRELCGGTHVASIGEIGLVKVVAESAISAGTRRIEAVAGQAALDYLGERESTLEQAASRLSVPVKDLGSKLDALLAQRDELERELKQFKKKAEGNQAEDLANSAEEKDGLKFVKRVVKANNQNELRSLGAQILQTLPPSGVVLIGSSFPEKGNVGIVALCSGQAIETGYNAGNIVRNVTAMLGGKGGGKPDFAMGGAPDPSKLEETFNLYDFGQK